MTQAKTSTEVSVLNPGYGKSKFIPEQAMRITKNKQEKMLKYQGKIVCRLLHHPQETIIQKHQVIPQGFSAWNWGQGFYYVSVTAEVYKKDLNKFNSK